MARSSNTSILNTDKRIRLGLWGLGRGMSFYEQCAALNMDIVAGCDCDNGCPGCVGPPNLRVAIHHDPDLGRGYKIPDKAATMTLLRAWLDRSASK